MKPGILSSNSYVTAIRSADKEVNIIKKLLEGQGIQSYTENLGGGWMELYVKGESDGKVLSVLVARRQACLIG